MLREAKSRRLDKRDGVEVESQNFRHQVKRDPGGLFRIRRAPPSYQPAGNTLPPRDESSPKAHK